MKKRRKKRKDSQLVELAGRNWLVSQLIRDGIEIARPERDNGVDLIAYIEKPKFIACRIQIKVASQRSFVAFREKYKGMLLVYVWHIDDPSKTIAYAMTSNKARQIAEKMKWTKNSSWKETRQSWSVSSIADDGELHKVLKNYQMRQGKWKKMIRKFA